MPKFQNREKAIKDGKFINTHHTQISKQRRRKKSNERWKIYTHPSYPNFKTEKKEWYLQRTLVRMRGGIPESAKKRAMNSTIGVFPLPPHVKLPTLITGTAKRWLRRRRKRQREWRRERASVQREEAKERTGIITERFRGESFAWFSAYAISFTTALTFSIPNPLLQYYYY